MNFTFGMNLTKGSPETSDFTRHEHWRSEHTADSLEVKSCCWIGISLKGYVTHVHFCISVSHQRLACSDLMLRFESFVHLFWYFGHNHLAQTRRSDLVANLTAQARLCGSLSLWCERRLLMFLFFLFALITYLDILWYKYVCMYKYI